VLKVCEKLILKISFVMPFLVDKLVQSIELWGDKKHGQQVEEAFAHFEIE